MVEKAGEIKAINHLTNQTISGTIDKWSAGFSATFGSYVLSSLVCSVAFFPYFGRYS